MFKNINKLTLIVYNLKLFSFYLPGPGKRKCLFCAGEAQMMGTGEEGVEELQLEVLELESGPWKTTTVELTRFLRLSPIS